MLPAGFPNAAIARFLTTGGYHRADRRARAKAERLPTRRQRAAAARRGVVHAGRVTLAVR